MNLGHVFLLIALAFFFMAGTGLALPVMTALAWGFFSLCLAWLLHGVPLFGKPSS